MTIVVTQKRKRHRHHANPFSVRGKPQVESLAGVFPRPAPLALDIGFGEGRFLLDLAKAHPEWNVLGFEIRPHFVEGVTEGATAQNLPNARALLANVNLHLDELVPNASVAFVAINFPDPWFKKRHQKRRVVNDEWVKTLEKKLQPGAEIHVMSDFEPIALEMLAVFEKNPAFLNKEGKGKLAPESTTGILTEREVTHTRRGEPIYRFHFRYGGATKTA